MAGPAGDAAKSKERVVVIQGYYSRLDPQFPASQGDPYANLHDDLSAYAPMDLLAESACGKHKMIYEQWVASFKFSH